jgi:hypothetical protein
MYEDSRLVFDRIRDANFKLYAEKCTYAAPQVVYLGHTVSKHGVALDGSKVRAIGNFPLPQTVKDVRAFLGLAGYYRSFIQDFAATSCPLTLLTRHADHSAPSLCMLHNLTVLCCGLNKKQKRKNCETVSEILTHPNYSTQTES